MDDNKKIVVLAGNRQEFRDWIQRNIICVSSRADLQKIFGIEIDEIYEIGTCYKSIDAREMNLIHDRYKELKLRENN